MHTGNEKLFKSVSGEKTVSVRKLFQWEVHVSVLVGKKWFWWEGSALVGIDGFPPDLVSLNSNWFVILHGSV